MQTISPVQLETVVGGDVFCSFWSQELANAQAAATPTDPERVMALNRQRDLASFALEFCPR